MLVYALLDPRDGAIRYVGRTKRTLRCRLKEHLGPRGKALRRHCTKWVLQLQHLGLQPRIVLLQTYVDAESMLNGESRWIRRLRQRGFHLTNHTDGGDGIIGYTHTKKAREKIRTAKLARKYPPLSDVHKEAISVALRGRPLTDGHRAALHGKRRGMSVASRQLMSIARKRWWEARRVAAV